MEYLGLHNKPKAEVHTGHLLTGPEEEVEEDRRRRKKKKKPTGPLCVPTPVIMQTTSGWRLG
jgi:hypothetical protein